MDYKKTVKLFHNVKTFTDLQYIYIKFLKGEIRISPDQYGPVNSETIPLLNDLVKINKLGFITTSGQPSKCQYEIFSDNSFKSYEQKGYITGFLEHEHLKSFSEYMEHQQHFFYSILNYSNETIIDTFPNDRYNLTRRKVSDTINGLENVQWDHCTNMNRCSFSDEVCSYYNYDSIYQLLENKCLAINIACKEYGEGSVEKLLLEYLKQQL